MQARVRVECLDEGTAINVAVLNQETGEVLRDNGLKAGEHDVLILVEGEMLAVAPVPTMVEKAPSADEPAAAEGAEVATEVADAAAGADAAGGADPAAAEGDGPAASEGEGSTEEQVGG